MTNEDLFQLKMRLGSIEQETAKIADLERQVRELKILVSVLTENQEKMMRQKEQTPYQDKET